LTWWFYLSAWWIYPGDVVVMTKSKNEN